MKNITEQMHDYLREHGYGDAIFVSLLSRDDQYKGMFLLETEIDIMFEVNGNEIDGFKYMYYSNDNHSIDSDFLFYLEDGYLIEDIPIDQHCNFWFVIDKEKDEISNKVGLNKYLRYCVDNGITYERLKSIGYESNNISHLYKEETQGYKEIFKCSFNKTIVKLGTNQKSMYKYATWIYNVGSDKVFNNASFFTTLDEAVKDYDKLSNAMFDNHLKILKKKIERSRDNER